VAAVVIALLAALVVWLVVAGGGGGGGNRPGHRSGAGPAPANSITPGPSGTGPAISGEPGGRDTSGGAGGGTGGSAAGGGGGTSGGAGTSGGTSSGGGGAGGAEGGTGSSGGGGAVAAVGGSAGAAGSGGAVGGGAVTARALPANSPMATCAPGQLKLSLDSAEVAYGPDQTPQFKLVVTNDSGAECKANLGPTSVVLTITDSDDDQVWTSKDCPKTTTQFFDVPSHTTVVRTVSWDRRHSTTKCSGPTPKKVGDGTYLAEVKTSVASVSESQTSIRLTQD
jgi:hypothetical protein